MLYNFVTYLIWVGLILNISIVFPHYIFIFLVTIKETLLNRKKLKNDMIFPTTLTKVTGRNSIYCYFSECGLHIVFHHCISPVSKPSSSLHIFLIRRNSRSNILNLECLLWSWITNYWTNFLDVFVQHSWFPENDPYWLWTLSINISPDSQTIGWIVLEIYERTVMIPRWWSLLTFPVAKWWSWHFWFKVPTTISWTEVLWFMNKY